MPSRPGEFHPEPLTDSGLDTFVSSGSCHRTKAAAFQRIRGGQSWSKGQPLTPSGSQGDLPLTRTEDLSSQRATLDSAADSVATRVRKK